MLAKADGNNVHIIYCLRATGEEDNPASIECHHDIGVVASYVQRAAYRTRGNIKHHRETGPRLHWKLLHGIEQTVSTGGIEHPPTADCCSITYSGGSMLTVSGYHPDLVLSLGIHLVQLFSNLSGRSDRIVAYYVKVYLFGS